MVRSKSPLGFSPRPHPVASLRLMHAVAASLVLGALALFVCVGLTLITSAASFAASSAL